MIREEKVRLLKGPVYESGLANFAGIFADRQREIEHALLLHVAISMDAATNTLASINSNVMLLALFQKLETPNEKALNKYIKDNGGVERFLVDDEALGALESVRQTLVSPKHAVVTVGQAEASRRATHHRLYGREASPSPVRPSRQHPYAEEVYASRPSRHYPYAKEVYASRLPGYHPYGREFVAYPVLPIIPSISAQSADKCPVLPQRSPPVFDLVDVRKKLNENIADSLAQNMGSFQGKMNILKKQLEKIEDAVTRSGDRIISVIHSGPHDRIIDPVSNSTCSSPF
jgi:hypothetical protein